MTDIDRAREVQINSGGAYVIGHSIGQRLPERTDRSGRLPLEYHRSIAELDKGLHRRPAKWHILAPPLEDEDPTPDKARSTADELIRYAVRLSRALRERAWRDAHPMRSLLGIPKNATFTGLRCPPIILLLDEGVSVTGASGGVSGRLP